MWWNKIWGVFKSIQINKSRHRILNRKGEGRGEGEGQTEWVLWYKGQTYGMTFRIVYYLPGESILVTGSLKGLRERERERERGERERERERERDYNAHEQLVAIFVWILVNLYRYFSSKWYLFGETSRSIPYLLRLHWSRCSEKQRTELPVFGNTSFFFIPNPAPFSAVGKSVMPKWKLLGFSWSLLICIEGKYVHV